MIRETVSVGTVQTVLKLCDLLLQVLGLLLEIIDKSSHSSSLTTHPGLAGDTVSDFAWDVEGKATDAACRFGGALHLFELDINSNASV